MRQVQVLLSGKTNLCQAIRATQGKGLMPDGTSRFSKDGKPIFHYMGTSTFSEYTVLPEISVAKISKDAPSKRSACSAAASPPASARCSTPPRSRPAPRWRCSGWAASACRRSSARSWPRPRASSPSKPGQVRDRQTAGRHRLHQPLDYDRPIQEVIVDLTDGGVDYSFECIGNVKVMRSALECCHKGWGESIIIGVAGAGEEISTRPFQLVTGRVWRGSAFGGVRGRSELPGYVERPSAARSPSTPSSPTPWASTTSTRPST
jgi:S-(hydroxymethyl)glutathione dehydrogenase/alcohol dehydrogenase